MYGNSSRADTRFANVDFPQPEAPMINIRCMNLSYIPLSDRIVMACVLTKTEDWLYSLFYSLEVNSMVKFKTIFWGLLLVLVLGVSQAFALPPAASALTTLTFSGYKWNVRSGQGGPGPNNWRSANVWVDANGWLHLKISKINGQWYAAELTSQKFFGFGRYQFQVIGRVDQFDRNIVLGLFNYPTASIGPDGTNEIDIEYSHWGNPAYPIGNFTVWPAQVGLTPRSHTFNLTLANANTTQRFTWASNHILFQGLRGFTDTNTGQYAAWNYAPVAYLDHIPQHAMPVHLNLWLFQGNAPVNGLPVEIIIKSFKFTPAN